MTNDPLAWIHDELANLESQSLRRRLVVRQTRQQPVIELDGRQLVNFSSNDYLGLAGHCLTQPILDQIHRFGWGSGASPLVTGRGELHAELESRLAAFEGTEAALLFTSGYAANVGTVTSLVGNEDAIFSDAKNHASIIDGCRLSRAKVHVYPHADVDSLRQMLVRSEGFRRRLIVTDGLFSMDGDLAPLGQLAELARGFGAMLMVDEAHATGVFGDKGRGVSERLDVEDGVHVRIGTLSKALGSSGGFVAGPQQLIDWIANRARTYIFSTAPPEPVATVALSALQMVIDQPERRATLLSRAAHLRERLAEMGWQVGNSSSQIIPLYVGDPRRTMQLHQQLLDRDLLVPGIRPPSVPAGESLLRLGLSFAHTPQMLDQLVAALHESV